ncbi:galactose mutarotase [Flavobacteriaceae bacterium PRS1]|jgi:aldose 1-epimerase|nr:galactose mutarotase [Flavobacteriaceae bacterium PRS1]
MKYYYIPIAIFMLLNACQKATKSDILIIPTKNFDKVINGKKVSLFTLKNDRGTITQITNYGGKVVSLWVADKNGTMDDIVMGYDNIDGYLTAKEKYFGALIGRYGNRIGNGKFLLESKEYTLATNNGANHLHGGDKGYDAVVWDAKLLNEQTLELKYLSKHLEEGYPGNLTIKVLYQLTNDNELKIEYWATTDQTTVVNMTHHSFFNLKGTGKGDINNHLLQINAAQYTPVDKGLIPTGVIAPVANTSFDFQQLTAIGKRINDDVEQLKFGLGYDHNWVLNKNKEGLNYAAKIIEPTSGRSLEIYTNEPGLQFYGGNFLDGTIIGKRGITYKHREAFCLETQHFPDSPNKEDFPSTILKPEEEYYSICIYKMSITN